MPRRWRSRVPSLAPHRRRRPHPRPRALPRPPQAPSSGAADDTYLAYLRTGDPAFASVPDASLINIGHITCEYFAQNGNGDASVVHVMDNGTSHGLTAAQTAAVIASAIESYCPQYKVGG